MLPRCGFKPPLLRTHCDSSADALHRTSRCTSSIAVAVPVARDGGFSRQLKAMPGRVALKSAPRKILRCRSWTCAACRTARRSARDGLPQQALNRAIVAASLGYGPSKTRLPNRSPAAAGKLCRGYNLSLTISNQTVVIAAAAGDEAIPEDASVISGAREKA